LPLFSSLLGRCQVILDFCFLCYLPSLSFSPVVVVVSEPFGSLLQHSKPISLGHCTRFNAPVWTGPELSAFIPPHRYFHLSFLLAYTPRPTPLSAQFPGPLYPFRYPSPSLRLIFIFTPFFDLQFILSFPPKGPKTFLPSHPAAPPCKQPPWPNIPCPHTLEFSPPPPVVFPACNCSIFFTVVGSGINAGCFFLFVLCCSVIPPVFLASLCLWSNFISSPILTFHGPHNDKFAPPLLCPVSPLRISFACDIVEP